MIGLRAVFAPSDAAAFFGVALDGPQGLAFVQAMGARNIGLALLAIVLLWLDLKSGVTTLLAAAAVIAGLDAWIVGQDAGWMKATKHIAYTIAFTAAAGWLGWK